MPSGHAPIYVLHMSGGCYLMTRVVMMDILGYVYLYFIYRLIACDALSLTNDNTNNVN